MKNLNRLRGAITLCVLAAGSTVYAQQAEPTLTDPPQAPQCEAPAADCPAPQAQVEPAPMPEPQPQPMAPQQTTDVDVYVADEETWYERMGFGLALGGGVDDFVASDMRDFTSVGGGWNLRATLGTQSYLAFEGSYIGSAQSIDALGLDDDAILYGNGLQGAVRVNVLPQYSVKPFVYGGAAWRRYDVSADGINTSDVEDSDDVFEVPVGVGISGVFSGFLADLRGEYRGAWGTNLIPGLDEGDAIIGEGDRWSVNASIGMAF